MRLDPKTGWLLALLCALTVIATINSAHARNEIKFGWEPAFRSLSIEDPNGPTGSESGLDALTVAVALQHQRDDRYLVMLGRSEFSLEGSQTEIGQNVESLSVSAYYKHRLRLSDGFKPWLGAGPVISIDEATGRFTVDQDGFLAQRFPDRDDTGVGLGLALSHEWAASPTWELGFTTEYIAPLSDSLQGFRFGLTIYYQ